ncbi:hypothetical protein [Planctomycetes bacterium K23_9]|uniref:Uncharacterized protein n=1 Tax=Stieleria marina TaxID=1930275 RepID=A0A517NVS5_9BACT|nr:hypothetical protein K239x_32020 [Planctomycetes bacterium K23_9]
MELIVVDDTLREERISRDLARADRQILPVNLIYPPNYPEEPAILLDEFIGPADALKVLERMEKIQNNLASSRLAVNH